jgi:hypothetical protein
MIALPLNIPIAFGTRILMWMLKTVASRLMFIVINMAVVRSTCARMPCIFANGRMLSAWRIRVSTIEKEKRKRKSRLWSGKLFY